MSGNKNIYSILTLVISAIILVLLVVGFGGIGDNDKSADYTLEKNLAGELSDNNLYLAAISEYEKVLNDRKLAPASRANINYLIAKIYFNYLYDYENAAAYYVRARALDPNGTFYNEAGKNLITCFEKMGRIIDAKRELNRSTNLDSVYAEHEGEKPVAKIDGRPIFLSDLEREIQKLPAEVQKQFLDKKGKLEYLNTFVATELMHQAAIREGYESDPEVIDQLASLRKQLMVEKYVVNKVLPEVDIDTSDIRNYYLANKETRYVNKEYDEVKTELIMDYQNEKAQQAVGEYVGRLSSSSNVQIFEENIK